VEPLFDKPLDLNGRSLPHYIAIEGPIGVGKTTLAKRLAQTFNYDTLLENTDANPFLESAYTDPKSAALPAQLFFLFHRSQLIQQLRQGDMFEPVHVADFLMEKDQVFAQATLGDEELKLYQQVYEQMTFDAPGPDLVVYLQAPVKVLHERIQQRAKTLDRHIDIDYLNTLNDAYMRFFHFYDQSPLLIVNAAELDLANNEEHYRKLVEHMLTATSGRHYYNPTPTL